MKSEIQEAYELQERITRDKKTLKERETLLKNMLSRMSPGREGNYEIVVKNKHTRRIRSVDFQRQWPVYFAKYAKVAITDVESFIPRDKLDAVCDLVVSESKKIKYSPVDQDTSSVDDAGWESTKRGEQ